ncbi:MAG: GNAT family N-acetyltransferase [Anaerolineales bacterium]|jgi:ribosomal-protein-alanine N-acetyltransferase
MTGYLFFPLTRRQAEKIVGWSYDPPYDVYDLRLEDLMSLLIKEYRYHQVLDISGDLVGYCCYGEDARVPGGEYSRGEPDVLDVGVGLRPDLVGQGLGRDFVRAILDFARKAYSPLIFRATVADFNQRSMKTFHHLGFEATFRFDRKPGGMPFTQLERRCDG